jgi:radical SAM superfamily enzyme YgiQ (UPF0313 family)
LSSSTVDIVLVALNARWSHASLALRCLRAHLGALKDRCALLERTLEDRPIDVVEAILAYQPRIVGLSVYVWNAVSMLEVARLLRAVAPDVVLVVGGPEVSHEIDAQEICALAHHVVEGEGEVAFRRLCEHRLGLAPPLAQVPGHVVAGGKPELSSLASPYALYDDVDVRDRVVYVEASRGCPFTCEFCLSSLDDGVRMFPLDSFLADMQSLYDRGLRAFKFIDRTFNLKIDVAERILTFFLEKCLVDDNLFVHFEMVPDRLPERLRVLLARFPVGRVQLEVGVQTLDPATSERISRRQNVERLEDNLRFLARETGVHVHADLIVGLPGEDLASFARGYDRLRSLGGQEIQVGILKRLRGAPIARHTMACGMVYATTPPYEVLQTAAVPFLDMQRLKRFARYHDVVVNSGRLPATQTLLMRSGSAFFSFLAFSDWLWATTGARHGLALARLAALVRQYLVDVRAEDPERVDAALEADLGKSRIPSSSTAAMPKRQRMHSRRSPSGEEALAVVGPLDPK